MGFNNGFEHVRLENKWKKLRIQYREAGMSEEAIQEMYNFDSEHPACHQLYEEGRLTSWTNAEPNAILSAVTGGATSRTIAGRSLTTK